ncbi:MAG TPA: type II toxin-antitoxin system HipA family toxin [Pseudonocardiaceae bacterium]|nr:type II toxin-antitoxin system HipA family toxin [Pseudonocardiaceae bacterium]
MATMAAEVRLHGSRVGELHYDRGGSTFRYEDTLTGPDHRVLGQIFEDNPRRLRRERTGLPPWFANLLPEGEVRRQIVRELGGGVINDYTLLLRLGEYLPGAVTVHAEREPSDPAESAPEDTPVIPPDHPLRHSQAGVQLKYTVSGDRLTFPASGDGAWWTVKLPDRHWRDLPINEYLTMTWLARAGFPVPPVQLVPARTVGGVPIGHVDPEESIYLIERFDRTSAGRVHFEDFAQVADVPPMLKYSESGATYDSVAATIRQLAGEVHYADFITRLAAMLVTGNTDAHLKNWALIYPDGRTPALAPVYDFHCLTIYSRYLFAPLALSLNGEKLAVSIRPDDFRRLADRAGADPERTVAYVGDAVSRLRAAWTDDVRAEAESVLPALGKHFTKRLDSLPICTAV